MRHRSLTPLSAFFLSLCVLSARADDPAAYTAEVNKYWAERDADLRSNPFSKLALARREYIKDRKRITFGSGPDADIRLPGKDVAPLHAIADFTSSTPLLRPATSAVGRHTDTAGNTLALTPGASFRVGRYSIQFAAAPFGPAFEIFDPENPPLKHFAGLDRFAPDPSFRTAAEVIPSTHPQPITLIDSQGNPRLYWVYGDLRFVLAGRKLSLELYTSTLDPGEIAKDGFLLMFTDETSGKTTYPSSRYLYVEGKPAGSVTVDFNYAFSPPCSYNSTYTCPFPNKNNHLPIAVTAGERYRWQ